jgi:hypothetical protein
VGINRENCTPGVEQEIKISSIDLHWNQRLSAGNVDVNYIPGRGRQWPYEDHEQKMNPEMGSHRCSLSLQQDILLSLANVSPLRTY